LGGKHLKGKVAAVVLFAVIGLILASNVFYVKRVEAEDAGSAYAIEWVNHRVEVMYNGYILINDTIKISGTASSGFLIGFPYQYGSLVLRCAAYNPTNPAQKYSMTTNVHLDNRIGFYGFKVDFPHEAAPQVFTVVFVLSNSLLKQNAQNTSIYALDFPAYPSFTTTALSCNASIVLPKNAQYLNGTVAGFNYSKTSLPSFAYEPANVTFMLTGNDIQLLIIKELRREIRIGGVGDIEVSDKYYVKNPSPKEITSVNVILPPNASAITAEDEFGRKAGTPPTLVDAETNCYQVSLVLPLESGQSTIFVVKYTLPRTVYLKQNSSAGIEFAFLVFQHLNYYIEQTYITLVLPEGAKTSTVSCDGEYIISREVFQEQVSVSRQRVFFLDTFTMEIVYQYNPLWLSFRPTLWVWALATFGCVVFAILKRPRAPAPVIAPTVAVRFSPEIIRSFVSSYEEKRKIVLEMESLEAGLRRGRIPRRRYKVQRKILETRLGTLSRNLDDLKQKLQAAGGRYADLMRQLEVAEAEISEVEANIRSIEVRHRRGELSLEAYRKLLGDYERRKANSETRISGILMRLREEVR
ncbi:MAG: hypothetical protein ACPLRY_03185, partial [Candidatus Bathyarchaeales archaeon]